MLNTPTQSVPALPFAWVESGACPLLSSGGRPVWPVSSAAEYAALSEAADSFGLRLKSTIATYEPIVVSSDLVVALGFDAELQAAARLYAHLTMRSAASVARVEELFELHQVRAVVVPWCAFSLSVAEQLFQLSLRAGIGVLLVGVPEIDRIQLLTRAAMLLGPSRRRNLTWLAPGESWADLDPPLRMRGNASATEVREFAGEGAAFFGLMGHSDGLDAQLGADAILCPKPRAAAESRRGTPSCASTGYCGRLRTSLNEAVESGRLVEPGALRCSIAVLLVCFGTLCADSLIEFRFGVMAGLLKNAKVGAVIAAWDAIIPAPGDVFSASVYLMSGQTAAAVASRLSRESDGRLRLLVFGDPDARTEAFSAQEIATIRSAERRVGAATAAGLVARRPGGRGARLALLQTLVKDAQLRAPDERRTGTAMAAIARARALPESGSAVVEMASHVLRCLIAAMPRPDILTAGTLPPILVPDREPCFVCARPLRSFVWQAHDTAVPRRLVGLCPRCAVVMDTDSEHVVWQPFEVDAGSLRLSPQLLEQVVGAAVTVRTPRLEKRSWLLSSLTRPYSLPLERGLSALTMYAIFRSGALLVARAPVEHAT